MPRLSEHTTSPQFSVSAFAAGLTAPVLADASNPDAELIALCNRLALNGAELEALLETQHSIEDEHRDEQAVTKVYAQREILIDGIWDMGRPSTQDGAKAMARAFSAIAPRDRDDTIMESSHAWMAFIACDFMAERPALCVRTHEEVAKSNAARLALDAKVAAARAEQSAEVAEIQRSSSFETMTREELERGLSGMLEMREIADRIRQRMLERLAGDVA